VKFAKDAGLSLRTNKEEWMLKKQSDDKKSAQGETREDIRMW